MKITAEQASAQALEMVIEWAKERGNKPALATLMTEVTSDEIQRQMIGRWLHPDPKEREQPRLGMGLVLLLCAQSLMDQQPLRRNKTLEITLAELREPKKEKCPDCAEQVTTIFDHVDGCPRPHQ